VQQARNWSAVLPASDRILVALRPGAGPAAAPADAVLAHPSSTIEFNQRAVPLGVVVQRFGAAPATAPTRIDITALKAGPAGERPLTLEQPPVSTEFAPAQYFDLTPDQLLAEQAFRVLPSGARAAPGELARFGGAIQRPYGYESYVRDSEARDSLALPLRAVRFDMELEYALASLGGSAVARSSLYRDRVHARPSPKAVQPATSRYVVVDAATMTPAAGLATQGSYVAAIQARDAAIDVNPALSQRLAIVAAHELG
jgi:hypothetical protein